MNGRFDNWLPKNTVGDYHELVGKLMDAAEALDNYGDSENKKVIGRIIKKLYITSKEITEEAKKLVVDSSHLEKLSESEHSYTKEWLINNELL